MQITHQLLLELGFVAIPNRAQRYSFRGITGRLVPEKGLFYFHGFSLPITSVVDLRYMLMLIDYHQQATFTPYPSSFN